MAKPIEITLVANSRGFIAGTKDAGKALDDVSDSLDDVARDAKRAGDQAGDGLAVNVRDGVRDSEQSLERLEGSFRELATKARSASDDAGTELGGIGRKTSETVGEAKAEIIQNAGETFASFRGDISDLPQIAQDSFGGIASAIGPLLGPAGTIAALAGAAGLGLVAAAFEQNSEKSEVFKQRVSELATEFIKTGRLGEASLDFVAQKLEDMAVSTDGNSKSLSELYRNYARAGQQGITSFEDVARAVVGAGGDYDDLIRKQEKHLQALKDQDAAATTYAGGYQVANAETRSLVVNQQAVVDELKNARDAADKAKTAQEAYGKAGVADLQAKADAVQHISDELHDGADDWQDYYDRATGSFDAEAYIRNYQTIIDQIQGVASFLQQSRIPEAAKAYIQGLPAEQAAAYIGAYKAAQPGTQAQLSAIWAAQGQASGASYVAGLKGQIPASLPGPSIAALVSTPDWAALVRAGQNYLDRHPIIATGTIAGRFGRGEQ